MKNNKVEICGVYSSSVSVLKEKKMKELLFRLQRGDFKCRAAFIKGNTRLILNVIQYFNNRGENMDDLFQVGCIGLMKAVDNFDVSLNASFSTYAVPMIIGEVRRYLKNNNSCRLSMSLRELAYSALQVRDRLVSVDNKEPTISQIAKELNLPCEEVIFALDILQDIEQKYKGGKDEVYGMDQLRDSRSYDDNWLEEISNKEKMKNLNHIEKQILNLRFAHGRTQMEAANEIGITKDQVSRLEKTALKNMRK